MNDGSGGPRTSLSVDLGSWPVDPEVRENTLTTAQTLRSVGAIVDEVDIELSSDTVNRLAAIHFSLIFAAAIDAEIEQHGELMTDYAREFPKWSKAAAGDTGLLEEFTLQAQVCEPVSELLTGWSVPEAHVP